MEYKFNLDFGKFRYMLITETNERVHIYKRYLYFIWKKYYTFPFKELKQAITFLDYLQNK